MNDKISATWRIGMTGTRRAVVAGRTLLVTNRRVSRYGPVAWCIVDSAGEIVSSGETWQSTAYSSLVRQAMLDVELAAATLR